MKVHFRSESFKGKSTLLVIILQLDAQKRIEKIIPKKPLNKGIKKSGLKFNPGSALVSLGTTWPSDVNKSPFKVQPSTCRNSLDPL